MVALLLALACGTGEPVLVGIPSEPLLETPATVAEEAAEPVPYARPENVWVDVRHLCGRSYTSSRGEIGLQLGELQSSNELKPSEGRELQMTRGTLRVHDDRVYMMRIPLPEPMRRTDALIALGFPTQTPRYITIHREYRLNHAWGFRRVRLRRLDRLSELVTEVEVWRWMPGEHSGRR